MNRNLKIALAALLGFSAACSATKKAPVRGGKEQPAEQADTVDASQRPQIIVMYGVRRPTDTLGVYKPQPGEKQQVYPIEPVVEKSGDDDPQLRPADGDDPTRR